MWLLYFLLILPSVLGCGFPGAPAHCTVSFSDEDLGTGTVAIYSCDRGFELLGPSRRICQNNGTWIPQGIPFCVLNVAAGKAPMQSSMADGGVPQKAVDGSTSGFYNPETCSLTEPERKPWWYVNLLEPYMIQLVRIDFGQSCCANNQQATIIVRVGNNRPDLGVNPICNRFTGFLEEGRPLFLPCNPPMPGAFISVHFEGPQGQRLSICEAFVYTDQALPIERCPSFRDQPPGSTATYNGKCYIFYNQQRQSFVEARQFCDEREGSLVDETNPALQGFLSWELWRRHRGDPNGQYWMGAVRDPQDVNNWKWINGRDVTVSFWNLPGGNEDCARFDGTKGWLWSDTNCNLKLNFICQHRPEGCGRPEQPPNSTLLAPDFNVGSKIEYRCDTGHLIVGPVQRTCLQTGFFSEFPPTCRYLECGMPAEIPHGYFTLINETRQYLSIVRYGCAEGYQLLGRGELVCDVDQRWNGPPPRCEPVYCPDPPQIPNGTYRLSTNSTILGTIVEYYCLTNRFTLVGAPKITCLIDGTYDLNPPTCIENPKKEDILNVASSTPRPTQSSYRPPPGRPGPQFPPRGSSPRPPQPYPHDVDQSSSGSDPNVVAIVPEDNEIPDSVNVKTAIPPNVKESEPVEETNINNNKLNLGGIIALGVFGGFVFLAAVITTIVILIRRNQRPRRRSPDSATITSYDSSGSEAGGLNKYYKRAWENLRENGGRSNLHRLPEKSEKAHPPISRKETLDNPNYRSRVATEGMRDESELVVSDAAVRDNKKRHHHHHHHHKHRRDDWRDKY